MTWPALLFWLCALAGALSRGPLLLYLFAIAQSVTTLQMAPGESLGGANLTPQVVLAAVLVVKVFLQPNNLVRGLADAVTPARSGLLAAFLLYGILSAFVLPRLFVGQVEVIPVSGNALGPSLVYPGGGNVTQSGYLVLSVMTGLAFAVAGTRGAFREHALASFLAGGLALIATGLADLVTSSIGLAAVLEPFRNATYSLLTDNEVMGAKRVVGLMPEASAFGTACVTSAATLTFLRPCLKPFARRILAPPTILGLLLMAALSTSSTAYVGLGVFGLVFAANWLVRYFSPHALHRRSLGPELAAAACIVITPVVIVVLVPGLLDQVLGILDVMLFKKTMSDSYYVRTMWTTTGWNAFLSTGTLGVGYGSLRTSNWFVALAGSTGLFGVLLLGGYMAVAVIGRGEAVAPADRELRRGLAFALIPWFALNWISGTVPDIGVAAAASLGLLVAAKGHRVGSTRRLALAA